MPTDPPSADRPLVAMLGPTGSGKSDLALSIAAAFDGEIVNCDSIQLYRGFDIGSAKTPPEERRDIPHHMIDVCDPQDVCTAGDYARQAREAIAGISERGRLPVMAGGTGFYVRALLDGLFDGPLRDQPMRQALAQREARRSGFLWRALRRYDRDAAQRIHRNDLNKLMRALEVTLVARRPMTELFTTGRNPLIGYVTLKLVLDPPRDELYRRLDDRSARIFETGLLDEVRGLLARGVPHDAKPFEAIGYKQALSFVSGELSRDTALEEMRRHTRRYSKRQVTWFRREPGAVIVSGFGTDEEVQRSILNTVKNHLVSSRE